jgi:hypothetical protein
MMISSDGTQFGLDFLVVEIYDWHLHPAQFVSEQEPVPTRKFGRLAQRELPDLEKADRKLKLQLALNFTSRFPARQEQVIRILQRQLSHAATVSHDDPLPQAHGECPPTPRELEGA